MPKGIAITEEDVSLMLQLRERGKSNKEIARILELSEDGVRNKIGTDKPKVEVDSKEFVLMNEKLDTIIRLVKENGGTSKAIERAHISLADLGYTQKDARTYVLRDGGKMKIIQFTSSQQINYKEADNQGKTIGSVCFLNANIIEAMFNGVLERNWTYLR